LGWSGATVDVDTGLESFWTLACRISCALEAGVCGFEVVTFEDAFSF
jgi:hypothetical protein